MASARTEGYGERPRIGGAVPRFSWKASIAVLLILGAAGWSYHGVGFNVLELFTSSEPAARFVSGMYPPDLSAATLRTAGQGILETLHMSFLGAFIGSIVAFPLAAMGARGMETVGASRGERLLRAVPYHVSRFVLNVFRSVPDILWALVFVVALGLGPFPGTLALAVHSAGVLGKLYSESLEAVPARPVEALASTGANGFQSFLFGMLPQSMSNFTALALYMWECNIRSAAILGFVGAGGIGQQILISMNLFDYSKVATLVGATVILVLLVDRLSAVIRRRMTN